jgi:hypothetical protein
MPEYLVELQRIVSSVCQNVSVVVEAENVEAAKLAALEEVDTELDGYDYPQDEEPYQVLDVDLFKDTLPVLIEILEDANFRMDELRNILDDQFHCSIFLDSDGFITDARDINEKYTTTPNVHCIALVFRKQIDALTSALTSTGYHWVKKQWVGPPRLRVGLSKTRSKCDAKV